eukprot:2339140-Alexandrium_andersonii.AAC.1
MIPLFSEAQHFPRNGITGKPAKCTRPVIYSEIIDSVPMDGLWCKNGLDWDREMCLYADKSDT